MNGTAVEQQAAYDAWERHGDGRRDEPAALEGAHVGGREHGLYYMRNRWYDPRTGRFASEDPIGLAGGMNLYTFGGNDPINLSGVDSPPLAAPLLMWRLWWA